MPTACPLCDSTRVAAYRRIERVYQDKSYNLEMSRCETCSYVFLKDPPPIPYDEAYLELERVVKVADPFALFHAEERLASIARSVPPAPDRKFLDIGIGDGLLLSLAEKLGYAAYGLDVNPAGIALARQHYGLKGEVRSDPIPLAYPGVRFDVIHMNEVIEHLTEPVEMLRWCRSHLAPQGRLIIQTGNLDSVAARLKGADWDYFRPVHVGYFSGRTLRYALTRAGLRIVSRGTIDWRPRSALGYARKLWRQAGLGAALKFAAFYGTALPYGLRRTILIHAART